MFIGISTLYRPEIECDPGFVRLKVSFTDDFRLLQVQVDCLPPFPWSSDVDGTIDAPFFSGLFDKHHNIDGVALDHEFELAETVILQTCPRGERKREKYAVADGCIPEDCSVGIPCYFFAVPVQHLTPRARTCWDKKPVGFRRYIRDTGRQYSRDTGYQKKQHVKGIDFLQNNLLNGRVRSESNTNAVQI